MYVLKIKENRCRLDTVWICALLIIINNLMCNTGSSWKREKRDKLYMKYTYYINTLCVREEKKRENERRRIKFSISHKMKRRQITSSQPTNCARPLMNI